MPPVAVGAGGVVSTASDLSRFMYAQYSPPEWLAEALSQVHTPHVQISEDVWQGLGWYVKESHDNYNNIVWHNGQTGGYRSFMGVNLNRELGITVLINQGLEQSLATRLEGCVAEFLV